MYDSALEESFTRDLPSPHQVVAGTSTLSETRTISAIMILVAHTARP